MILVSLEVHVEVDEGHGEKSVVCNRNFETGRKIRASRSGRLELSKQLGKIGELLSCFSNLGQQGDYAHTISLKQRPVCLE